MASIRILIRSIFCEKGKTTKTRLECKKPLLACQCKATFSPNAFFHVHFKELSNDKTWICIESKNMNFVQGILARRPLYGMIKLIYVCSLVYYKYFMEWIQILCCFIFFQHLLSSTSCQIISIWFLIAFWSYCQLPNYNLWRCINNLESNSTDTNSEKSLW